MSATWVSGLGTAFIAAGLFAPLAALAYGIAELRLATVDVIAVVVVCASIGGFLHYLGRLFLRRLRE